MTRNFGVTQKVHSISYFMKEIYPDFKILG